MISTAFFRFARRIASVAGVFCILALPVAAQPLRIALTAPVNSLDPHVSALIQSDLSIASHLYAALITRGPDLALQGDAAESWKAEDDLNWRITLRPDLRFPNGEPLDAEAVKWNIERITAAQTRSRQKIYFDPIRTVTIISPTELRLTTSAPYPVLPAQLTTLYLMPPKWTAEGKAATDALGTGPYTLRSFTPGDRIVLAARPGYHGPRPNFEDVEVRMIAEPSVRAAALQAGELDFAVDLAPGDVTRLNASGRVRAGWSDSNRMMSLRFNTTKPPFDNKLLRQAVSHAIDRQAIAKAIFEGHSSIARCQLTSPMYFGFNPSLESTRYDPALAKRLIAASGVRGPIELELEVPLGRYLLSQEIAQVLAAQLEEIGIKVQLREMEFGAWIAKYNGGNLGASVYMGQGWPTLDADGLLGLYAPSNPVAYWKNDAFGAALDRGRASTDETKRREAYAEATRLMCDETPAAFLFTQPLIYATSPRVTWQVRGDDWVRAMDFRRR